MLGLVESGRSDLVRNMLDNFAYLITTVGHIPNGNRTYYLGRSQPPFFAAMVGLYAKATDTTQALRYLSALEAEHAFWMDGADRLTPGQAYRRVVMMPEGVALNRYWDDLPGPRPESYRPDFQVARDATGQPARTVLSQRARGGGERVGFLEPMDARSVRSQNSGDHGTDSNRPQQPDVQRRAHDRGAALVSEWAGRRRRCDAVQSRRGAPATSAPHGRVRAAERILLRRALANVGARY